VRQTGGADHQRQREQDHVQRVLWCAVYSEAELGHDLVELGSSGSPRRHVVAEQAERRDRVAGQLQRDEDRRDGVGQ
jgi:hypothetical protein